MCGVETILADDSLLTCRLPDTRNPVRIICDSQLRTPPDSQVAATCSQARTILATCCPDREAWLPYEEKGCEILLLPPREGRVDLNALTERLGQMGIDSVLLEGGSTLNWSALNQGIVNRVQAYISPGLFGAQPPKHLWEAEGWNSHTRAFPWERPKSRSWTRTFLSKGS